MNRLIGLLAVVLLIAGCGAGIDTSPPVLPNVSGFRLDSGANLPWINYGWDVGRNPWGGPHGGFSTNVVDLNDQFAFLAIHGVMTVRVFIFADLRSGLTFSSQGMPLDLDSYAAEDFSTLVSTAEDYGLKLIPVLFDYTMADGVSHEGSTDVGEHPDLITDPVKQAVLFDLLQEHIIQPFGNREGIQAWEVINEPENASAVNHGDLRGFVFNCTEMIHQVSDAPVTVGCRNRGDLAGWTGLDLDFYEFHYFDSMEGQYPFDFPVEQLGLDRPVLVGECQPTNVTGKLDTLHTDGYAGVLFWSLNADYDFRSHAAEYDTWMQGR